MAFYTILNTNSPKQDEYNPDQIHKLYRDKMDKTLSELNTNMDEMLKDSISGIDAICNKVRLCLNEMETEEIEINKQSSIMELNDEQQITDKKKSPKKHGKVPKAPPLKLENWMDKEKKSIETKPKKIKQSIKKKLKKKKHSSDRNSIKTDESDEHSRSIPKQIESEKKTLLIESASTKTPSIINLSNNKAVIKLVDISSDKSVHSFNVDNADNSDMAPKRACVDIHQKLVRQMEVNDSLSSFIRLMRGPRGFELAQNCVTRDSSGRVIKKRVRPQFILQNFATKDPDNCWLTRKRALKHCDIFDELDSNDLAPIQSVYPRRDEFTIIEKQNKIENSYLYKLIYEYGDGPWETLFQVRVNQLLMPYLNDPMPIMHAQSYTIMPVQVIYDNFPQKQNKEKKSMYITDLTKKNDIFEQVKIGSNPNMKRAIGTANVQNSNKSIGNTAIVTKQDGVKIQNGGASTPVDDKNDADGQKSRQSVVLKHLQGLKERNSAIHENIQKTIQVVESKMVDILSSPNHSGSIEAFDVIEKEITNALKMMENNNDQLAKVEEEALDPTKSVMYVRNIKQAIVTKPKRTNDDKKSKISSTTSKNAKIPNKVIPIGKPDAKSYTKIVPVLKNLNRKPKIPMELVKGTKVIGDAAKISPHRNQQGQSTSSTGDNVVKIATNVKEVKMIKKPQPRMNRNLSKLSAGSVKQPKSPNPDPSIRFISTKEMSCPRNDKAIKQLDEKDLDSGCEFAHVPNESKSAKSVNRRVVQVIKKLENDIEQWQKILPIPIVDVVANNSDKIESTGTSGTSDETKTEPASGDPKIIQSNVEFGKLDLAEPMGQINKNLNMKHDEIIKLLDYLTNINVDVSIDMNVEITPAYIADIPVSSEPICVGEAMTYHFIKNYHYTKLEDNNTVAAIQHVDPKLMKITGRVRNHKYFLIFFYAVFFTAVFLIFKFNLNYLY